MPNFRACSPIPGIATDACEIVHNGVPGVPARCEINRGAACDSFLTSNPALLTAAEWDAQIAQWLQSGETLECMNSADLSEIKAATEKLCSKYPCNEEQEETVKIAVTGLKKLLRNRGVARAVLH